MSARTIQLTKEARQILWPWIVVTLSGLISLAYTSKPQFSWGLLDSALPLILPAGCFLGIPLLAALPLGSEFQHGTLPMLFAQPVDRRSLWRQKTLISLAAVLPAAILHLFAWRLWQEVGRDSWMAAGWIVATTAGAVVWTLVARSTIGGLALGSGSYWTFFMTWLYFSDHLPRNANWSMAFQWATGILLLSYCVALVWFGRRVFLRFQATEGALGAEALKFVPGTRFLPNVSLDWLRSRPHGAILNLIRREFHLLRTVWLLSLFSLFIWTGLVLLGFVRPNETERAPLPAGLGVVLSLVIALLAGSLSLGEEKNWGTHGLQLTLPLSASAQWSIKLAFALCASVLCAFVVPLAVLLTRGWISGTPFSYLDHTPIWVWFVEALVAAFLAFWCSCVFKGTVRSVLYVFLVFISLGLSFSLGNWLGLRAAEHSDWLLNAVANKFDPFRLNHSFAVFVNRADEFPWIFGVIIAPLLAVGLIQSLRLFRMQLDNRRFHPLRSVLPPLATLLLSSFALAFLFWFTHRLQFQEQDVLRESNLAIQRLEAGRKDGGQLKRFTVEDLTKAYPLSDRTRYWLRDSTILVAVKAASDGARPPRIQWPYEYAFLDQGERGKVAFPYSATIRTGKGSYCNLNFWASGENERGFLTYACE